MSVLILALLLLLKLTVADRVFPLQYVFYLPALLTGPATLLLVAMSGARRMHRLIAVPAVLVLFLLALRQDQPLLFARLPQTSPGEFSILNYNVMAYALGDDPVNKVILDQAPDILCLVEGTFAGRAPRAVVRAIGNEYTWAVGNRLSIASRFPIIESRQLVAKRDIAAFRSVVNIKGTHVAILLIDINPPTRRSDQVAFDELFAIVQGETLPFIVTGDFNVPRGSHHLGRAMEGTTDSLLAAPTQHYQATWPTVPLPLLVLDFAFHSDGIKATRAEIISRSASDHFPVRVEYVLESPP